ncbi:hypothetical protein FOCC_FOCC015114 [Frankliniella occidentalis]|nr:hypothetical protein FOCC_FOCC015114 [Frankliniella occidentalis]
MGGGSSINGMMFIRGSSVDYDDWAKATGDSGWNSTNMLALYKRAESNQDPAIAQDTDYHSQVGPQPVSWQRFRHPSLQVLSQAMEATGLPFRLDVNGESQLGHSFVQTSTKDGERWSTYRCLDNDAWRWNRVKWMPAVLHPRSRGRVRLNASDPLGQPIVEFGYLSDEGNHDLAVMVEGLRMGVVRQDTLAKLGLTINKDPKLSPSCSHLLFGSDEHLACLARTTTATLWHWTGTCRMGREGDETAVVDPKLRVKGVLGLRVADASVMPSVPSGNTNAPTIMVAERAATLILSDHGLPRDD